MQNKEGLKETEVGAGWSKKKLKTSFLVCLT
jgi:hypothetical protein